MMHMMSLENSLVKRSGSSIQKRKGSFLTRIKDSLGHGSSYKSAVAEVSQDIVCPQATATVCAPAVDTVSDVRVTIAIQKRVSFGERIAVVGETDALGHWRPCDGVPLTWSGGDVWSAEISLQPGMHEFKVVTVKPDGNAEWELGSNRVIEIPADAGALQARCQWANTSHTTLVAVLQLPDAFSIPISNPSNSLEQPLLLRPTQVGSMDSVGDKSSLWSAQSTDAAVDLNGMLSAADEKLLAAAAAPAGCLEDDESADSSGLAYGSSSSAGKQPIGSADQLQDEQQLIGRGSYRALGTQESSGDLSSYAYEYSNSSSSISDALVPESTLLQQQQLTSAALTAAEAAAVEEDSSSAYASSADADDCSEADGQHLSATLKPASFMRLEIPSAPSAAGLFSPISTTSTRPLRGAVSSSTLSFSSMEVSEAMPDESIAATPGAASTEDNLAAAAYLLDAAATAAAVDSMGETVTGEDSSLADLLTDPLAFEQLMAVEPAQLSTQQQKLASIPQSAKAGAAQDGFESVFAAAAAAAAKRGDSTEIMDAAAAVCELGPGVDPSQLLPNQETLPPATLLKFAEVSVLSEITAVTSEITAEMDDEEEQALLDMSVSASDDTADMRESSTSSSARSSFSGSSSSSMAKDQLPDLGLTVTVPTAADKAAAKAAEMSAAKAVAAAVKSKRRSAAGRGAVDDLLEPPVAQQGLRLLSAAHMIPHVDKVSTGGEDAFFVSPAGHGALGVSDGVSAWAEDGIDPGEYSRTLVQYCAEAFEERVMAATRAANRGSFIEKFDPRSILRYAQQCTCKPGSATVVLAALQPGGKLHVANLGDCGVKVVRNGKVVYETQPQQHDFNLPYQLSHPRLFPDTDTADSADRWVLQSLGFEMLCGCIQLVAGSML
eukprot:GHUV01022084.1.p1 GENE.GHUV01022084.1~~GHUV01022084.1.p1  ORF type:complete len:892 (+),score=366.24 GHUV01022084.1:207-2882(+)